MDAIGAGHTDRGRKRDNNEDAFHVDDALGLYVVSDGMGGHAAGEVASQTALAAVKRHVEEHADVLAKARRGAVEREVVATLAAQAVQQAAREVYELAKSSPSRSGMGCTVTAVLTVGAYAVLAHVGDSRLYHCRNGGASQLSVDHTMAHELMLAGVIEPGEEEEHPYSHVLTRAVGTQPAVQVDTLVFDLLVGDRLVLCTDGLADYVDSTTWLARQVPQLVEVEQAAEELVSFANEAGGKDNITVVVVRIGAETATKTEIREHEAEVRGKLDALGAVFLFEELSPPMILRVLEHCRLETYGADTVIVEQGAPSASLYVVVDGSLALERDGEAADELGPGQYVGLTTLLAKRPARAELRSREDSKVLVLDQEAFWSVVRSRPWLGIGLFQRLGRKLSQSLDQAIEQRAGKGLPRLPGERF